MSLLIRRAEPGDCLAVASLIRNELGYSELDFEKFRARMGLIEADPLHATFVAEEAGRVVGFLGLLRGFTYEIEGEYLRVLALAVSREHQGKGVGGALLNRAEELAREFNISRLTLNSGFKRLEAHAFYEKNGFVKRSYGFSKTIEFPD